VIIFSFWVTILTKIGIPLTDNFESGRGRNKLCWLMAPKLGSKIQT
jgi:hypothetical protein